MVERAGSFFQDEPKLETNPKVGFCWMRKGKQKPLRTPGTNRKVWISGALKLRQSRPFASASFVVAGEQPGGAGVVVVARGGEPQPSV